MADSRIFTPSQASLSTANGPEGTAPQQTIVLQSPPSFWRSWTMRLLLAALGLSVMFNFGLYGAYRDYFASTEAPLERFHSGSESSRDKIALLQVDGTIMPPFTERLLKQIERVGKDDQVKGVLLVVDSPGGLVADSHEIYHRLKQISEKKPIFVQMKRMAASGGYYIAMGAGPQGRIFAEPTTWTGSIGVIIPRYDFSKLAEKYGIGSDPLKTGEFKDALNPFRPMSDNERKLWENILDQSFQKFIGVIDENRVELDAAAVKVLATGQIFTADDAKQNKLIDEIGYEEDSLKALKEKLKLKEARVIKYKSQQTLVEQLLASTAQAKPSIDPWRALIDASVPRALYLCSWWPALPE
jgi:protease IV